MRLNVLVSVALLGAFLPRCECRAVESPGGARAPDTLPRPLLLRLGEEFFLRLGGVAPPALDLSPPGTSTVNRALQLTRRLLQGKDTGDMDRFAERGKRSEDSPISLDLTFHLLREVLEMARAEQLAQQADSNRRMMDIFGK